MNNRNNIFIPESFICPITCEVMRDPVQDREGNSYERTGITDWLSRKGTSPISNSPMKVDDLVANRSLRNAIEEHLGRPSVPATKAKVVLLGYSQVGKTCVLERFIRNTFRSNTVSTMSICNFESLNMHVNENIVKLEIWDTAGQERYFSALPKTYFRDVVCGILVFDITDITSWDNIPIYLEEMKSFAPPDFVAVLVGNKLDLGKRSNRVVTNAMAADFVAKNVDHVVEYIETSAKTGENVNDLFQLVARKSFEVLSDPNRKVRRNEGSITLAGLTAETIQGASPASAKKRWCC